MPRNPTIGSISHGTMRAEDLLPAFAHELRAISDDPAHIALCDRVDELDLEDGDDYEGEMDELFAALNECAPPYCFFGAHPGDGADYGFWPDFEVLERPADFDILKVEDLSDISDDYRGEVMIVNDHGNVTMGWIDAKGEFQESWSCV